MFPKAKSHSTFSSKCWLVIDFSPGNKVGRYGISLVCLFVSLFVCFFVCLLAWVSVCLFVFFSSHCRQHYFDIQPEKACHYPQGGRMLAKCWHVWLQLLCDPGTSFPRSHGSHNSRRWQFLTVGTREVRRPCVQLTSPTWWQLWQMVPLLALQPPLTVQTCQTHLRRRSTCLWTSDRVIQWHWSQGSLTEFMGWIAEQHLSDLATS